MKTGAFGGPRSDAPSISNPKPIKRSLHFQQATFSNGLHKPNFTTKISGPSRRLAPYQRNQICTLASNQISNAGSKSSDGPLIVWFKHDLRIDDHPGLHEALISKKDIIPFFCFDPKRYEALVHSPASAAALARSVASLRSSLPHFLPVYPPRMIFYAK